MNLGWIRFRRRPWQARLACALLTGLAVWGAPAAEDISPDFEAANRLYEAGQFSEAAAAYDRLLQSGISSPALYFNWGNAQFKAGQVGGAIAAYRLAEQLTPRDPDLRTNLRFARAQVTGPTWRDAWLARALGRASLREWTLAVAAVWWVWFGLLIGRQLQSTTRRSGRGLLWITTGLLVLLTAGWAFRLRERFFQPLAVVISQTPVRNGPFDESPEAFTVHDGAELRVLDQKNDWLQVQADPRRIGWLPRERGRVLPAH